MPQKEKKISFFKEQMKAFKFKTQFGVVCAGKQSGKTFLGAYWAGNKLTNFPNGTGLILAPTYKILQSSTLKKFFQEFPPYKKFYKEQKQEIKFNDELVIFCRSADNPLSFEGITADWIWGDEIGMYSRLAWITMRGRVAMTGGQILGTTTAYNLGWLYQDYYIPWRDKIDKSLSFFEWESVANPKFSKEFFEQEKMRLSLEEFDRMYRGKFTKMTGLVYNLNHSQIITPDPKIINGADKIIYGIDWGFKNPAGILVLAHYNFNWYIIDEWKEVGKTTGEIIITLQNFIAKYRIGLVFPDPAEPDRILELEMEGIMSSKVTKNIRAGVSHVNQFVKANHLYVFNTCVHFIDEINTYHYPLDVSLELPVKSNDHLMDCLRYALYSFKFEMFEEPEEIFFDGIVSGY